MRSDKHAMVSPFKLVQLVSIFVRGLNKISNINNRFVHTIFFTLIFASL